MNALVLEQILDQIALWIWAKNLNGEYLYVNQAFCDGVGVAKENILGRTDNELLGENLSKHYTDCDAKVVRNGDPVVIREFDPNATRHFETLKFPIRNDSGHVVGTCGVARDTEWQNELVEIFQETIKSLEQGIMKKEVL